MIPAVNTVAFLVGADPARRSRQIDLETVCGPEMYATFVVVGCALSMQPFSLRSKLKIIVGNWAAVVAAGVVPATFSVITSARKTVTIVLRMKMAYFNAVSSAVSSTHTPFDALSLL